MNKIICDKCKEELTFLNAPIVTKYLTKYKGINIQFIKCPKCKTKYLIDVTDGETRDKQRKIGFIKKLNSVIMKQLEYGYNAQMDLEIVENNRKMEDILKEIKKAKAELKIKYEGE